ncbi:MAG: hypothetical protein LCI00_03855 [Chloroflexi bacterium]|nr:hypothetical protein [Chloroflexota bacterium]MCC6891243.1 hypothetical protein [Anaerolineae bacterium]
MAFASENSSNSANSEVFLMQISKFGFVAAAAERHLKFSVASSQLSVQNSRNSVNTAKTAKTATAKLNCDGRFEGAIC